MGHRIFSLEKKMAAVQMKSVNILELRLKQTPTDVWSVRERLCLASSVQRSGDQNWVSVSRAIKPFGEPNRPQDWFSQKNCALQYSDLLEKVETPKRKRGERDLETPGEFIVRKLTQERIEELEKLIANDRLQYKKLKQEVEEVRSGEADDRLQDILNEINEEKRKQEKEAENFQKWLLEREASKQMAQAALRASKGPLIGRKTPVRRTAGGRSSFEQGGETDAVVSSPTGDSDSCVDEPSVGVSTSLSISTSAPLVPLTLPSPSHASSHHSPLLNTLLRSSSQVSQPATQSIPKEVSPRSQSSITSPTISSLLSSSPNIPTSIASSVANLLTTALSGPPDHESMMAHPRPPITSPSQGAPTLLKLLDMPLGAPGKLPPLPVFSALPSPYAAFTTVTPSVEVPMAPVVKTSIPMVEEQVPENPVDLPSSSIREEEDVSVIDVIKDDSVVEIVTMDDDLLAEGHGEVVVEVTDVEEVLQEIKEQQDGVDLQEEEVITEVVQSTEDDFLSDSAMLDEVKVEEVEALIADKEETIQTTNETILNAHPAAEKCSEVAETIPKQEILTPEKNLEDGIETSDVKDEETPVPIPVFPETEESVVENATTAAEVEVEAKETSSSSDSGIPPPGKALPESVSKTSTTDDEEDEDEECSTPEVSVPKPAGFRQAGSRPERRRRRGGRWRRGSFRGPFRKKQPTTSCEDDEKTRDGDEEKGQGKTTEDSSGKTTPKSNPEETRPKRGGRKKVEDEDEEEDGNRLKRGKEKPKKEEKKDEEREKVAETKTKEEQSVESILGRETDDESKDGTLARSLLSNDSIPNSPASASISGDDPEGVRDYKLWKKAIMLVWRAVANHKFANIFLHPVTEEMAPGYHIVVYRPMDLMTIKKNIENGVIRTTAEFQRDVMLLFQNAIMYNNSDHDVYKMAIEMQKEVVVYIKDFMNTQLIVQSSAAPKVLRRETREHSQKRGDAGPDILQTPVITQIQSDVELKRKRTPNSESEGGKTKRRRTRADD